MTIFVMGSDPSRASRAARIAIGLIVAALGVASLVAARQTPATKTPPAVLPAFADVTDAAGLRFRHNSGAFGQKYLPETMGAGGAFLDVDRDGWQDVLLINSKNWPGRPAGRPSLHALYRNNRNGSFTDITARSGLDVSMYGMGAAAADYDNDGEQDVYITALDGNKLFRGLGGGKFEDVTARAGTAASGFSTCAVWFDSNNDGRLDLFVCRYVDWSVKSDLFCTLDGKSKSYCTPESYKGQSPILFLNDGKGSFQDVTKAAGLYDPASKALGVTLIDYDGDGRLDLFVANDTQPNRLYRNRGDGTFTDVAVTAGIAFNEAGVARAGMGVDAADYDGSGRPSLVIGNFSNEMMALYTNEGNGLFVDEAPSSTIGRSSLLTLTFGCFFFDYDLDGLPDIFAANGHVADDIQRVQPRVSYAQTPHLFRNLGGRRFEAVTTQSGPALRQPVVARGAAHADYDLDGDPDVLITTNNGPAKLLRNDAATAGGGKTGRALRIALRGTTSNRDGIGARVTLRAANGARSWQLVRTGSSYLTQSELPLTFGLGQSLATEAIEITWPGGRVDKLGGEKAGQTLIVEEGRGVIERIPLGAK